MIFFSFNLSLYQNLWNNYKRITTLHAEGCLFAGYFLHLSADNE